jgi:hypothetical protein
MLSPSYVYGHLSTKISCLYQTGFTDISNELGPLGVSDRLYFPGFAGTLFSLLPTQVEEKGLLTVVHDKSISGDYALQRVTCP